MSAPTILDINAAALWLQLQASKTPQEAAASLVRFLDETYALGFTNGRASGQECFVVWWKGGKDADSCLCGYAEGQRPVFESSEIANVFRDGMRKQAAQLNRPEEYEVRPARLIVGGPGVKA